MKELAMAIGIIASLANIGLPLTSGTICCDFFANQEIIVHHPNNYGYFYVRYNGEHIHSKAAFNINTGRWVCGCGAVL